MPDGEFRSKAQREIGLLSVKVPGDRRPVLLGTILNAGLKAVRPGLDDEERRKTKLALIDSLLDLLERLRPPEDGAELHTARRRIAELEVKLKANPVFTAAEVIRIRTLVTYGMTPAQVAKLFEVATADIRRALSDSEPVALGKKHTEKAPQSGRRRLGI